MRHGNLSHYQKEWSQSNCLLPCSQGMTGEAQEWGLDFDLVGAIACSWLLTSHNGVGLIMKKDLLLWRSWHLLELSLLWSLIWILNEIRWGCQNFHFSMWTRGFIYMVQPSGQVLRFLELNYHGPGSGRCEYRDPFLVPFLLSYTIFIIRASKSKEETSETLSRTKARTATAYPGHLLKFFLWYKQDQSTQISPRPN